MHLQEIGEFGLIDRIRPGAIVRPETIVLGIGDDAAAYIPAPGMLQLATTDMLVEGVHFDLSLIAPEQLGHKSLAVNLSDIAAMGGAPRQAMVAVAVPPHFSVEFIEAFYKGLKGLARQYGVNLIGGDTVAAGGGFVISVTALGEVAPERLCCRSGARAGDLVAVTGFLGDAAAGLACLQGGCADAFAQPLIAAHLTPRPRVLEGGVIARFANSMDDISDGLAREAREIATASGVGIKLRAAALPLSPALCAAAKALGVPPLHFALYGGEDYALLFTIEKTRYAALCAQLPGAGLTVVGEVTGCAGRVELVAEGKVVEVADRGYNHFRKE